MVVIILLFTDIELRQNVNSKASDQQVTLDCFIFGTYETSNMPAIEFWFNNSMIHSCELETKQSDGPQTRDNQPYAHPLNNTSCRLIIPRAVEPYTGDYWCQAKLRLNTSESNKLQQNCYLLSKPVTVSVIPLDDVISTTTAAATSGIYTSAAVHTTNTTPTQHTSNIYSIVVPSIVGIILLIVLIILLVVMLYKCAKHCCQQRQLHNGELQGARRVQDGNIERDDIQDNDNGRDGNGHAAEEGDLLLDFQGGMFIEIAISCSGYHYTVTQLIKNHVHQRRQL